MTLRFLEKNSSINPIIKKSEETPKVLEVRELCVTVRLSAVLLLQWKILSFKSRLKRMTLPLPEGPLSAGGWSRTADPHIF